MKTASQTYNVNNYNELDQATHNDNENVTININSNITLTSTIQPIESNIKNTMINGNGYTINGNRNSFLTINQGQNLSIYNLTIINCYLLDGGGTIYNNKGTLTIKDTIFETTLHTMMEEQ